MAARLVIGMGFVTVLSTKPIPIMEA